jgi:glucan phosphoethanolaminetransferase (alkaline phosphatase superfamily)
MLWPNRRDTPGAAAVSLCLLGAMRVAPLLVLAACATRYQTARSIVTILLAGALEVYLIAGLTRTWRSFFLAGFPFVLVGVLYAGYTAMYGTPPGRSLAFILLTTSTEEVVGFLGIAQGKIPALAFVALAALYLFLAWRLPRSLRIMPGVPARWRIATLALLLPVIVYVAWKPDELIDGVAYDPPVGTVMFFAGTVPRASATLRGAQVVKVPFRAHRDGGEEVHVLVLGESARRDSWSVFGYARPTTPYLNTLQGEAIFLRNAVADANLTSWAVPVLLTGMTPEQLSGTPIRGNIVDLAKEAGYATTWLLNQDITISNAVGIAADHIVYPPDFKANITDRHTFDEALLPAYRSELARAGGARFIGIHSMGSHWEYYRRYPASFRKFGSGEGLTTLSIFITGKQVESEVTDTYDNTVAYTDWFLQQIIEPARKLTVPATVIFFPDHGEDLQMLDGESGHGAPAYTPHAFAIPAFVWVNDAYRKAHPDKIAALESNATKEIRSHDLFGTAADLMGISWPGRVPARSFASEQFVPDTVSKFNAGGVLLARP